MHRHLEALLAFPRERARALIDEAAAVRELAADVGRYAAEQARRRYLGQRSIGDPLAAVLDQIVLDAGHSLIEAKKGVAVAIADGHRLRHQTEQEHASAAEWEHRAALADKAGDLPLAREARARQQEHAGSALTYHRLWTQHQAGVDELKAMLRALNTRIEQAKRDKNRILTARHIVTSRDDVRDRLHRMDDAVRVLDRLFEVALHLEPMSPPPEGEGPLH